VEESVDVTLSRLLGRARRRAVLDIALGLGISIGLFAVVSIVSTFAIGGGLVLIGLLPFLLGMPIAIRGAGRLRALRRLRYHPEQLVAAELALYREEPGLRFCFAGGATVELATPGVDREAVIAAVRSGLAARPLPPARVVQ